MVDVRMIKFMSIDRKIDTVKRLDLNELETMLLNDLEDSVKENNIKDALIDELKTDINDLESRLKHLLNKKMKGK